MKNRYPEVRVVDAGPLPAHNREVLEELLKKVVLRKLKQMHCEAQRKASYKGISVGADSNQPKLK
jgi:hypothetical protein